MFPSYPLSLTLYSPCLGTLKDVYIFERVKLYICEDAVYCSDTTRINRFKSSHTATLAKTILCDLLCV